MPRGMCIPFTVSCNRVVADMGRIIYTYRRGVCVARFDKMGDARASARETSNSTGSTLEPKYKSYHSDNQ